MNSEEANAQNVAAMLLTHTDVRDRVREDLESWGRPWPEIDFDPSWPERDQDESPNYDPCP